jgi:Dynamin family
MSQQSSSRNNNNNTMMIAGKGGGGGDDASGAFPSFTTTTSSASTSSASSSERTLLASNRSKSSIEPGGRISSLGMAAAAAQLVVQQQQQQQQLPQPQPQPQPQRSRSAEPLRKLPHPVVTTRVFQPSVVRPLPATVPEDAAVDSSSEDEEYDRGRTSSAWTAFGQDDSRLPTISPPNLPIMMDHQPSPVGNNSSNHHNRYLQQQQQHNEDRLLEHQQHQDEPPLSPTNTDRTTATTESDNSTSGGPLMYPATDEHRRLQALSKRALTDTALAPYWADEDLLLEFVAKINNVYEHTLRKDAPFMTFVLCGIQSAGKSYLVERFMNAVLNIVDDGTATRCPLDITCLHNADLDEPLCDLEGLELTAPGINLSVQDVFERVTQHNQRLEAENRVSKKALHLIYRANNVQNMRFVDTPGTKMNQDGTRDDRRAIQDILVHEMRKPNAKLCILLQSTEEFATQPIVRFCDDTFGSRGQWIGRAIFLMTKSDLLIVNKRSAADANKFFAKFHDNHCFPHLIITPTLSNRQGLTSPEALYNARSALLATADEVEARSFDKWLADHDRYNAETTTTGNNNTNNTSSTVLDEEVKLRIGFASAKKVMRNIMLEDTRKRLPEVLLELRGQLETLQRQWDSLDQRRKVRFFCLFVLFVFAVWLLLARLLVVMSPSRTFSHLYHHLVSSSS